MFPLSPLFLLHFLIAVHQSHCVGGALSHSVFVVTQLSIFPCCPDSVALGHAIRRVLRYLDSCRINSISLSISDKPRDAISPWLFVIGDVGRAGAMRGRIRHSFTVYVKSHWRTKGRGVGVEQSLHYVLVSIVWVLLVLCCYSFEFDQ